MRHAATHAAFSKRLAQAWLFSLGVHALALAALGISSTHWRALPARLTDVAASTTQLDLSSFPTGEQVPVPHDPQVTAQLPAPDPQPSESPPIAEPVATAPASPAIDELAHAPAREAVRSLIRDALAPSAGSPAPAAMPAKPPAPQTPKAEPRATFAGVEATPARRIVYLVDGSGSMVPSMNFVKSELIGSVNRLDEEQRFQVVVFRQPASEQAAAAIAFARPDMVPATQTNKSALPAWVEAVTPGGKSDLAAGLTSAMAYDPDIIFVLSRGIVRSGVDIDRRNAHVLATLESINPRSP